VSLPQTLAHEHGWQDGHVMLLLVIAEGIGASLPFPAGTPAVDGDVRFGRFFVCGNRHEGRGAERLPLEEDD
jgi:hypothetical protein